ncbi:MAG: hypothetical protein NTY77_16800 [Elusimicrobia bacterium]|nr:hypothetical protein [Elusimicrobiota bacterium]
MADPQGRLETARAALARVPALLWLAAAVVIFFCRADASPLGLSAHGDPRDCAVGEALVHGLRDLADADPAAISWSMPLQGVLCDLSFNHAPPAVGRLLPALFWLASLGLVFSLGQGLHSGLCGGLAALVAAPLLERRFNYEAVYTVLMLTTANLLVQRARSSRLRGSLLLAGALGLSLLERSVLFLFGPLLALGEGLRGTAPGRRAAVILALVPFLFLLPWVGMNWRCHRELVLFERGRADNNIAAGALGLRSTVEGGVVLMTGAGRGGVLTWAVGEIASHPGRYLAAVAMRLWLLFRLHPLLFGLSILAAWRLRGAGAARQLALLAGYTIGVHCLMAVKPSYLIPLWPILAALAASLPADVIMGGRGRAGAAAFSRASTLAAFWAVFAAGAFTLYRLSLYPRPAATTDTALAAHPADAGLWAQRARLRLKEGRPAEAIADLRQALLLRSDPEVQLDLAWALLARGGPGADHLQRLGPPPDGLWRRKEAQLRMLAFLQRGRDREAAAALSEAESLWAQPYALPLGGAPGDQRTQDWLMRHDDSLREQVCSLIAGWPGPRRFSLAAGWERIARRPARDYRAEPLCGRDRSAGWWRESSEYGRSDVHAQELRALAREQRLRPSAGELLEPALACQRSGDQSGALRRLEGLAREHPREAAVLNARGIVRALRGEIPAAVRDLRAAIRLDRFLLDAYLSLGAVYAGAGQAAEARRVYDEALRLDPRLVDPRLRGMILAQGRSPRQESPGGPDKVKYHEWKRARP